MTCRSVIAVGVGALLLGAGCNTFDRDSAIREGTIEYSLSFPEHDPQSLMAGMLPEKTTLYFSNDRQLADLSAGMGMFRTSMVVNNSKRQAEYHMSVMSRKLVSCLGPGDLSLFQQGSHALEIIFTNETDSIAGYQCRKALALFNRMEMPEAELWYTDAIGIKDPNWFGPYAEIPGVLLRYDVMQYGMRMRLTATSVTPGPVDEERFRPREGYQRVAPEVFHKELLEVLSAFNI